MRVTPDVLRRHEARPEDRPHSDRIEIIGRHDAAGRALGPVADGERSTGDPIDDERLEQRAILLKIRRSGDQKEQRNP